MDPLTYNEVRTRPSLEERLESIISGAALMADSSCTRDERRERIVQECNAVRQALQDLLSEYMSNVRTIVLYLAMVTLIYVYIKKCMWYTWIIFSFIPSDYNTVQFQLSKPHLLESSVFSTITIFSKTKSKTVYLHIFYILSLLTIYCLY